MAKQTPLEKINQRRKQLHIHSVIYYHLHTSIVSDAKFDGWANELVELHEKHPELVHQGYMPGIFADWTGDTGMHLPFTDHIFLKAEWLVEYVATHPLTDRSPTC